jgi:hypothetical protein
LCLPCPKSFHPVFNIANVFIRSQKLKAIEVGNLTFFRNYFTCKAKAFTEITVPGGDNTANEGSVIRIIEKTDDRFGNSAFRTASAIGWRSPATDQYCRHSFPAEYALSASPDASQSDACFPNGWKSR